MDMRHGTIKISSAALQEVHMSGFLSGLGSSSATELGNQARAFSACFGTALLDSNALRVARVAPLQMETCGTGCSCLAVLTISALTS